MGRLILRESYRQGGKVRKRTLANLTKLSPAALEGLRALLRGGTTVGDLPQSLDVVQSQPYGHVAAVLGSLRQLDLDRDLAPRRCRERDLIVAMIVARILEPASKLATARGLGQEAPLSALVEELDLGGGRRPGDADVGPPARGLSGRCRTGLDLGIAHHRNPCAVREPRFSFPSLTSATWLSSTAQSFLANG